MVQPVSVKVVPTLARMAEIYSLGRNGGRGSPRFSAYLGDVEHNWGLAAFNPMAGVSATETVYALTALDAERLAQPPRRLRSRAVNGAKGLPSRSSWPRPACGRTDSPRKFVIVPRPIVVTLTGWSCSGRVTT